MRSARVPPSALVALVVVLAVGAGAGGYLGTHALRHKKATPVASPPAAYRAATALPSPGRATAAAPMPSVARVRAALAPLVGLPELGTLRAEVVDAASGRVLLRRSPATGAPPASTAKLVTAAAVLAVRRPTYRIRTRVRTGAGGAVVLVGAGDPTLSGAAAGKHATYPGAARISDLAAQLRRAHIRPTRIVVDDLQFSGPTVNPAWATEDVPSSYASAITALLADGGRAAPADGLRSAAPDLAAGHELAALLGRPALPVVRGHARIAARVLATVSSAPLGTLVEQMLQSSDNVIAECLARQVALASGQPVSFAGGARAVRSVLRRLGIDPGAGMLDGSGLAARDRLSAATLADTVRLATQRLALRTLLAALPVAAWSGTLIHRYGRGASHAGAGVVRAKTGTLTGVATLAGTVHDRDGRLLTFAFMSQSSAATTTAEAALDKLAAKLATL
jgi:D-alanyl-D-alanine carboxypeptidase/D-alanyl-D-alanine-endopeptidase (penicillin-binding protein 4)